MTTTSEPAVACQPSSLAPYPTTRGLLIGNVDDDDVGELLIGDCPGDRGANRAGTTYNGDFSLHLTSLWENVMKF